jgi:hypothetical protein
MQKINSTSLTKDERFEIEEGACYMWLYNNIKDLVIDNEKHNKFNCEKFEQVLTNFIFIIFNNEILPDYIVTDICDAKLLLPVVTFKTQSFLEKYNPCPSAKVDKLFKRKYKTIQKRFIPLHNLLNNNLSESFH